MFVVATGYSTWNLIISELSDHKNDVSTDIQRTRGQSSLGLRGGDDPNR